MNLVFETLLPQTLPYLAKIIQAISPCTKIKLCKLLHCYYESVKLFLLSNTMYRNQLFPLTQKMNHRLNNKALL